MLKKIALIIFVYIVVCSNFVEAQIDSCWYLQRHMPSNGYYNPDTTYIDTCFQYVPDNPGKHRHIAKRGFRINTSVILIDLPEMPRDTIYEFSWHEINTNLIELRQQFQEMENKFGTFALRKKYPDDNGTVVVYLIRFNNYQVVDTIMALIAELDKVTFTEFEGYPYFDLSGATDNFNNNKYLFKVYPNPVPSNEFKIEGEFKENETLLIIDLLGNEIKKIKIKQPCNEILLNDLLISNGKYFILYKNKAYPLIIEK